MSQFISALKFSALLNGETFNLAVSVVNSPMQSLECQANYFLSEDEKKLLEKNLGSTNRYNYLLGRYAAKLAIRKIYSDVLFKDITISSGIFGQPLVNSKKIPMLDISLAHAGSTGISLIAPYGCPIGIDVEESNASSLAELLAMSSSEEICKIMSLFKEDTLNSATILWVLKEALSKTVRCGFTLPLKFYEISSISNYRNENSFLFKNFPQYRGFVSKFNNTYFGFVFPKALEINDSINQLVGELSSSSIKII